MVSKTIKTLKTYRNKPEIKKIFFSKIVKNCLKCCHIGNSGKEGEEKEEKEEAEDWWLLDQVRLHRTMQLELVGKGNFANPGKSESRISREIAGNPNKWPFNFLGFVTKIVRNSNYY
jgi:hypothetical protein